jgi:hypothetical protein
VIAGATPEMDWGRYITLNRVPPATGSEGSAGQGTTVLPQEGRNSYQVTENGRKIVTAIQAARRTNAEKLTRAA